MKRISIVGLCLAAVFAFSAGAASSASAADLLARVAGGGSVAGVTFLSLGELGRLTTHSGKEIHCTHVHDHGLFLTSTLGAVLILFLNCTAHEGITVKCNTVGSPEGQIHLSLSTLFHLGLAHLVLSTTTDTVPAIAILLPGTIEIKCTALVTIKVLGAVIGALQNVNEEPQPLNVPFTQTILNFQQTANGLQHLRLILMPGGALTSYDLRSSFNNAVEELAAQNSLTSLHLFTLPNGKEVKLELVEP